jgi:hypothetical protein
MKVYEDIKQTKTSWQMSSASTAIPEFTLLDIGYIYVTALLSSCRNLLELNLMIVD